MILVIIRIFVMSRHSWGQQRLVYHGINDNDWNDLPDYVRLISDIFKFKRAVVN